MLRRSPRFFFETSWLAMPGFKELVQELWDRLKKFSRAEV
jgi:hypothetical protein